MRYLDKNYQHTGLEATIATTKRGIVRLRSSTTSLRTSVVGDMQESHTIVWQLVITRAPAGTTMTHERTDSS
jgi:hypothetical protein